MRHYNFNKPRLRCKRCFHVWTPIVYRPKLCPKCKNPNWNVPKIKTNTVSSPTTKTITKTTTTAQIGIKVSDLGIPIPVANIEHKKEVVKKE